jgi:hypothetical protein
MRALAQSIVALFLIMLTVGPLNLLQGAAWLSMLIERSQSMALTDAVSTTFDGRHPCSLCKVVEQERHDDAKIPNKYPEKIDKKFECVANDTLIRIGSAGTARSFERPVAYHGRSLNRFPPTPPPKIG